MMLPLHGYQERAIDFCMERRTAFLAMDIGLGKTRVALEVMKRKGQQALILAPLQVVHNTWPDEIIKWTPGLTHCVLHGPRKKKMLLDYGRHADIIFLNYEGLRWLYNTLASMSPALIKSVWTQRMLIMDESGMLKDPSTKRTTYLRRLELLCSKDRLALSATPAPNGLHELWNQFYFLDGGRTLGPYYTPFRQKYFDYDPPPKNRTTIKDPKYIKVIGEKIAPTTYRLKAKDYLDMPDLIFNPIRISLPRNVKEMYKKLNKEFCLTVLNEEIEVKSDGAKSNKLRQLLQGCIYTSTYPRTYHVLHDEKLQALDTIIETSGGKSMLIALQYKFEQVRLKKRYKKYRPEFIVGGVAIRKSKSIIKRWNEGRVRLLFVHPKSVRHGLNLQSGGHILVWLAQTWSLDEFDQLNGRLHRQGQRHPVIANMIIIKESVDEVIQKAITTKGATQELLFQAIQEYAEKRVLG